MMMPFIHANERFKRVRKLVVTEMRPSAVTEYFHPVQSVEVHRLVNSMIQDAKDWRSYVSRAIASIVSYSPEMDDLNANNIRVFLDHDDSL